MAFLQQDEDDKSTGQGINNPQATAQSNQVPVEQTTASGESPSQGTGVNTGAAGGTSTPASSATPQNAPQKTSGSGTFTNLRQYLNANQGNRVASAAAQNLKNTGTQAQKSITQGTNAFGQQVEKGTLANRQNAVSDIAGIVNQARAITVPATQAAVQNTQTPNNTANSTGQAPTEAVAPSVTQGLDTSRFTDVINAQYSGPQSLQQAGLLDPISKRVTQAQTKLNQAQTAQGREDLLRQQFGQNREYTIGQNKLDSLLLNASPSGVQNLLNQKDQIGNLSNQLTQAQNQSSNLATNRSKEIRDIQNQARGVFSAGKTAEESATEARLEDVKKNFENLPNYFRDIISGKDNRTQQYVDKLTSDYENTSGLAGLKDQTSALQQAYNAAIQQAPDQPGSGSLQDLSDYYNSPAYRQYQSQIGSAKSALDANQSKINEIASQKEAITNQAKNQVFFTPEEAAYLGLGSSAGLYNAGADIIKSSQFNREAQVSKNEQARQAALSALAGLDTSKQLDTNLRYGNAALAGTQNAESALDREATSQALKALEKQFQSDANRDIIGTGSKKDKSTGKRYYSDASANLADVLQSSGYDFNKALESVPSLKQTLTSQQILGNSPSGTFQAYRPDQAIESNLNISKDQDLNQIGVGGALSPYTDNSSLANKAAMARTDMLTGGLITRALGIQNPISDAISGVFGGGGNSRYSKGVASELAQQDLQNKLTQAVQDSGFYNRAVVGTDQDINASKNQALRDLLAKLDRTNS